MKHVLLLLTLPIMHLWLFASGEGVRYAETNGSAERQMPLSPQHLPKPKRGTVTVALQWENADIDMDLNVAWPAGEHDIADANCSLEHFHIDGQSIVPGTYAIFVSSKGRIRRVDLPEVMVLDIRTPDEQSLFGLRADTPKGLNPGHVADVRVDREHHVTFVPAAGVTPLFLMRGDSDCTYDPALSETYIDDIIARLPQLQYGVK